MNITLFGAADGWHILDLQRAAREQGHRACAVDFRHIQAAIGRPMPAWFDCDAAIVRTMPPGSLEQVVFRMDVLHQLEARGIRVLNPPRALEICIDKYLAAARLEAAGLRVPETMVCQSADRALDAFTQLGGDVVVKPIFGSEGRGMMRISDPDLAWRTFRTLERLQHVAYVQKHIAHAGWDLRVFVLGERILAAMKRTSGNWRTNVAQGGKGEPVAIGADEESLALRAAQATGVIAAGVDLLRGPDDEWYVLEVNAVPGWRSLAKVCRVDVAAELIRMVSNRS